MLKALPTCNFGIQSLTKCAEIFCYNFTEFTFCCTFCQNETFSFEDFIHHVKYLHFSNESGKSNDEVQEFNNKLKEDEKSSCNSIEQTHNDNPDNKNVVNELEYSKGFNDKELYKLKADGQELIYSDDFSNNKTKLRDKEKNTYHNIEENELEHNKDFSDKAICHNSEIKEINSYESGNFGTDSNISRPDVLSDDESLSRTSKEKEDSIIKFAAKYELRLYNCSECNAPFLQNSDMHQHVLKQHSGLNSKTESRFICDYENCNKVFKSSGRLLDHKNIHKAFICNVCGLWCKSKQLLEYHLNTHSDENPFSCKVCSKRFAIKKCLNIHMRTHADIFPHKCSICNKAFIMPNQLKLHMYIHSDVQRFKCKLCIEVFKQPSALGRHMRSMHYKQKPKE